MSKELSEISLKNSPKGFPSISIPPSKSVWRQCSGRSRFYSLSGQQVTWLKLYRNLPEWDLSQDTIESFQILPNSSSICSTLQNLRYWKRHKINHKAISFLIHHYKSPHVRPALYTGVWYESTGVTNMLILQNSTGNCRGRFDLWTC
jgi:hypothetical protein